jgi:hypothetical protein
VFVPMFFVAFVAVVLLIITGLISHFPFPHYP